MLVCIMKSCADFNQWTHAPCKTLQVW